MCALLALAAVPSVRAELPLPPELADVGADTRIGAVLDPALPFVDANGRPVRLADAFDGERPVVLALAWYRCTMVCGLLLAGLADAARRVEPPPGEAWRLLAVSYDAADTTADAAEARRRAGLPGADWGFWTGSAASISALTTSLGVRIARDRTGGQVYHPVVAFVLTGDGVVSDVLYGPAFDPVAVSAAVARAGEAPRPDGPPPADPVARSAAAPSRPGPATPLVCARPESPPPVYRAWLRSAGLAGTAVAIGVVLTLLLRARSAR